VLFLSEHDQGRRPDAQGCPGGGFNSLQQRPHDVHKSGYVWVFDRRGARQEAGYAQQNVGIVSRTGRFMRFTQERRGRTARVSEIGGFDPRVYGGEFPGRTGRNMVFFGGSEGQDRCVECRRWFDWWV
jgi:hypothetical protein